jgi:3-hydroxyacyl-CoA dehydrogenase
MPHITKSLISTLPADDRYCKNNKSHPVIDKMIADGYIGRKGKGGFYRLNAAREKQAIDLNTGAERPSQKVKMKAAENAEKKGLRGLVETHDKGGDYAWAVLKQTLSYAAEHVHEITSDITGVDEAMKLGYSWKHGPFELIDKMGVDYFIKRLEADGEKVPEFLQKAAGRSFYHTEKGQLQFLNKDGAYENVKRPEGTLLLSDIKRASKKPVARNKSASVWDIGDGVLCLEFHSKANTLNPLSMHMINKACDLIEGSKGKYKALVIHNEAEDFSAGANIGLGLYAAKAKQYWLLDKFAAMGQATYKRLKYAPFPVVAAPSGKALGGGCEILLHSHHVQAHAETYPGLVEAGVGLLPAWGGSTELLTRAYKAQQAGKLPGGPIPPLAAVFEIISTAKVGLSAFEAKDLMYLRKTDGVTMNKSRLLADAKAKALEMAKDFKPEVPMDLPLAGATGLAAVSAAVDAFFLKGDATPYDVVVSNEIAKVLTGGDAAGPGVKLSQDDVRALERKGFMKLMHDPRTLARIDAIIKTGKPLREKPVEGRRAPHFRDEAEDRPGLFKRAFSRKKSATESFETVAGKPAPATNDNKPLIKKLAAKVKKLKK